MDRLSEKLLNAHRALIILKELINLENVSEITRDVGIQRFEYCFK